MSPVKSICVFCGHRQGVDPAYLRTARELGTAIARRGFELVYGAGQLGLMGAVAEGALDEGGRVTGVIPDFLLKREAVFREITNLIVVEDMDQRKREMFRRSGAFIVLPGGFGTLDETFEAVTLTQLEVHEKPLACINVCGFFEPWKAMIRHIVSEGFCDPAHVRMLHFVETVDEAMGYVTGAS